MALAWRWNPLCVVSRLVAVAALIAVTGVDARAGCFHPAGATARLQTPRAVAGLLEAFVADGALPEPYSRPPCLAARCLGGSVPAMPLADGGTLSRERWAMSGTDIERADVGGEVNTPEQAVLHVSPPSRSYFRPPRRWVG